MMGPFVDCFKEQDKQTEDAFENPQVGDRFTEMYSYFMYVIGRRNDKVVIMDGSPPCTFPEDGKMATYSLEEFRERFSYGSIPGYWVHLVDRGNDVRGWLEEGVWNDR